MDAKYLCTEELDEIERLMDCAFMCPNKKEAQRYIQNIQQLGRPSLLPPANHIFGELLCDIERASGRVDDKERLMYFAKTSLYKLRSFGSKTKTGDEADGE